MQTLLQTAMKKVLDDKTQITNKKKLKKIEDEIWKELPGSNGLYFVSNYGRIKLYKIYKKDGEIIKGTNLKGYRVISLYIKGKSSRVLLHKLVAETWITKPSKDCKYVIHLDWNKKNNQV
ncbi:MAG: hypothetical protein HY738_04340 [Bacteroidia bacterium]|nr:hypothetical protein [Bacteroidia bacterium]